MKKDIFKTDNFLLHNAAKDKMYTNYAAPKPIIDYHNHLSPMEIAEDNITQVWIAGDHYKWRAMRNMGVNEKYITGNASDKENFMECAKMYSLQNPLYH
jgi:glucuronate isomerase